MAGGSGVSYVARLFSQLLILALIAGYEIFMVGTRGATLGKMALGLKVTTEGGSPPDFQVAAMRVAPYVVLGILSAVIPFFGYIAFPIQVIIGIVSLVFLFTDARRQTVWDKLAKTMVVNAR